MVTGAELAKESSADESDAEILYAIDEQAYEDAGESYLFKAWQRLCWSGECRLCRRYPDGKPIVPGRTTERSIYNAAKICAKQGAVHHSGDVVTGSDFPHLGSERKSADEVQRYR